MGSGEKLQVQENMTKYGGNFIKHLGLALMVADHDNAERIKKAFPEYWEEYLNIEN